MLAYRFGAFAYVTDVSRIPEASLERLRDLDTLILGALRHEPHPTHFTIEQALAWSGAPAAPDLFHPPLAYRRPRRDRARIARRGSPCL